MNNIISSDFYRVRRGAALRNTFLGVAALILFTVIMVAITQNDGIQALMPDSPNMSAAERAELEQDIAGMQQEAGLITNGADMGADMLNQSAIMLFFLPIAVAVFCADFSAGTYRNTLSFESNRTKVYLAKLLLSLAVSAALVLATLAFTWLVGGIAFGFTGFTGAYFAKTFTTVLLQAPIFMATVAVCHCLIAITKKSSTTIAIFLVGFIAIAAGLQVLAASVPGLEWVMLLNPQSGGKIVAARNLATAGNVLFVVLYNLAVTLVATVVGIVDYRKTDMP